MLQVIVSSLLLPMYTNDIVNASNFDTVLYADDINFHNAGEKTKILEKNV